jgi:hypothetical protein
MSNDALVSYRRSGLWRNEGRNDILVEAPGGEETRRHRRCSAPRDEPGRALPFGVERGQGCLDPVGVDALAVELEADRRVALATVCEHACALPREALLVEEAEPQELFDDLVRLVRAHPRAQEALAEGSPRVLAPRQRPRCHCERVAPLRRGLHLRLRGDLGVLRLCLCLRLGFLRRRLAVRLDLELGQQPRRDDLLRARERLYAQQYLLGHVGVLA